MWMHHEFKNGVFIRTRSDRKLFNLARLKIKKTHKELIIELIFADDIALIAHNENHCGPVFFSYPKDQLVTGHCSLN